MEITIISAFLILIPFMIFKTMIWFGFFFQKRILKFLSKLFVSKENSKSAHYKKFILFHSIIWISVGLLNVFLLDKIVSLSTIIVFLAFGTGANLSKRFIFGIHDIRLLKKNLTNNIIESKLNFLIRLGIITELSFLVIWGLLYQYLKFSVKSLLGVDVNLLVIILWLCGFIYALITSFIFSRFSKQILLQNEFGIAVLMSGQLLRERSENKIKSIRKFFKL